MTSQEPQDYYAANPGARWLALTSICLSSIMTSSTMSSSNVAAPVIARELAASAVQVSWVPTAYLLSNVIMILPAGRLADRYGRKRVFLTGIVVFACASFMASRTGNIEWLLFTRVLQGIGSAMTFATGLALIISVFSSGSRGTALGLASTSVYLGVSAGPLAGGWLTENFGWRSVFLFPIPIAAGAVTLLLLRLRGEWRSEQPDRLDWFGCLLFTAGISLLYLGISAIPQARVLFLLPGGLGFLVLFIYQQLHTEYPLIRIRAIMSNRIFFHSLLASVCTYASNFHLIFLFSLYLQFIRGMAPDKAGQVMMIQAITMALVAPFSGRLSDRFEARILATAGCLVMTLGLALLLGLGMDTPVTVISTGLLILGLGFGLFTTPNNNAALSSVDNSRLSIASALLNLARLLGNMGGTALLLLLVSIYIGQAEIEPSQFPALLRVIHRAVAASCLFALLGAWFSYARGNVHTGGAQVRK